MSLYLTDAQIAQRLGLSRIDADRAIAQLSRSVGGRRPFPQPDPLFGNRRFWPAVEQWLFDYNGVRPPSVAPRPADVPARIAENLDAFDPKARKAKRTACARPAMAPSQNG